MHAQGGGSSSGGAGGYNNGHGAGVDFNNGLYRTVTSTTTHTISSASSCRTVRPSSSSRYEYNMAAEGSGTSGTSNGNDHGDDGHAHGHDDHEHHHQRRNFNSASHSHSQSRQLQAHPQPPQQQQHDASGKHYQYPHYPYVHNPAQHQHQSHPSYLHHPSFPPIPPARSSSLHMPAYLTASTFINPASSSSDAQPPSVLVTHATPTKTYRTRRKSAMSSVSTEPSPTKSGGMLEVTVTMPGDSDDGEGDGDLDGEGDDDGDGDEEMRGTSTTRDEMEYDPEDEKTVKKEPGKGRKAVEDEEKKARAREKGRERQRRKRERDKKAREEAKAAGLPHQPAAKTALTTATHLPIPTRTSSATYPYSTITSYPFTMSVPSSTSSTYSSLPPSQPTWAHSPNLSIGSTASLSGQSSPGGLFSPAVNQSNMLPPQQYPASTHTPWSAPPFDPERHQRDMDMSRRDRDRDSRDTLRDIKPKIRSVSSGALPPDSHIPLSAPAEPAPQLPKTGPSPAKRRKSEPEPEEFRDKAIHPGSNSGFGGPGGMWTSKPGDEPPRPRRSASDGIPISASSHPLDTPPTLSTSLYSQVSTPPFPAQPTEAGHYFASTIVHSLITSGSISSMGANLGLGVAELEEMKPALAAVFEQFRLQRGMRSVSLGSSIALPESEAESYMSSGHLSSATTDSGPTSPVRFGSQPNSATYFTPAAARTSRPVGPPNTLPTYGSMHFSHDGSGLFADQSMLGQGGQGDNGVSNDAQTGSHPHPHAHTHSRTRSLSTAEMVARGLVINPGPNTSHPTNPASSTHAEMIASNQLWPDTPLKSVTGHTSSGTTSNSPSVSIHTPSSAGGMRSSHGSAGFPTSESMDSIASFAMPPGVRGHHMRSMTDTSGAEYMFGPGQGGGHAQMPHHQGPGAVPAQGQAQGFTGWSMPGQGGQAGQPGQPGQPAQLGQNAHTASMDLDETSKEDNQRTIRGGHIAKASISSMPHLSPIVNPHTFAQQHHAHQSQQYAQPGHPTQASPFVRHISTSTSTTSGQSDGSQTSLSGTPITPVFGGPYTSAGGFGEGGGGGR